jgi:hypothetical protein
MLPHAYFAEAPAQGGAVDQSASESQPHIAHLILVPTLITLAVALLYVWLISIGTSTIRNGLRGLVDRTDRRDLSIFQIGLRFIERCVVNAFSFRILWCSYR